MSNRYYVRPNWRYRFEVVDKQDGHVASEWKTRRKASKECQILNGTYQGDTTRASRGLAPRANRLVQAKEQAVQSSLSEQLKAGREPFVASERKGEAA